MGRTKEYLTEKGLAEALKQLVGKDWLKTGYALPKSRCKFDMAFRSNGATVLVEYDGDVHYRKSLKIKKDREKDELAKANSMRVIRVPYWVQWDSRMVRKWFGIETDIKQKYRHGFHATEYYPASFCELGIVRFRAELASLPEQVREEVIASLRDRAKEHGIEYVLPTELRGLLSDISERSGGDSGMLRRAEAQ